MKTKVLPLFAVLLLAIACDKDQQLDAETLTAETLKVKGPYKDEFKESRSTWRELKKEHKNSYAYTMTYSYWNGFQSATTITVKRGTVVSRSYTETLPAQYPGATNNNYTETGSEIGSHVRGAEPLPMGQLYNNCAKIYFNVDQETNAIYFQTDANGLMSLCGYTPLNCEDDCLRAIQISSFEWLE